jgi:hypothetical protein
VTCEWRSGGGGARLRRFFFVCCDGTAAGDGVWFGFESYGYVWFAYYLALSVSGNNLYWGREVCGIIE